MTESDEILYPNVYVDGEIIEDLAKKNLEGKSLEVYQYLVNNPGPHGVRELETVLEYSSPSVAYYHLTKLLDVGYVQKNEEGKYFVEQDEVDLGSIGTHIRFLEYWIPRSIYYAIPMFILTIISITFIIINIESTIIWAVVVVPITLSLGLILVYDAYQLSNKLRENKNKN